MSLPWIQVKSIKVRESKFGTALVIETSDFSGGYILGFKLENLDEVFTEITGLFKVYTQSPVFGVECSFEDASQNLDAVTIPRVEDNVEIIDAPVGVSPSVQYYLENKGERGAQHEIEFSNEIGLAIEKMPEGMSIESLWKIN